MTSRRAHSLRPAAASSPRTARSGSCARRAATCPEYRALRAKVDFVTLTRTPGAGRGSDPAAAAALRARCGDPVQRHHDPAAGHGHRPDLRAGPGGAHAHPHRCADGCAAGASCPSATCRSCWRPSAWCAPTCRAACRSSVLPARRSRSCAISCAAGRRRSSAPRARSCMRSRRRRSGCCSTSPMPWASTCGAGRAGAQALMLFESWAGLLAAARVQAVRAAGRAPRALAIARGAGRAAHLLRQPGRGAHAGRRGAGRGCHRRRLAHGPCPGPRRSSGPARRCRAISIRRRCLRPPAELKRQVDAVLAAAGSAPGHIFNLGHGIWPDTDPDAVARLIDYRP